MFGNTTRATYFHSILFCLVQLGCNLDQSNLSTATSKYFHYICEVQTLVYVEWWFVCWRFVMMHNRVVLPINLVCCTKLCALDFHSTMSSYQGSKPTLLPSFLSASKTIKNQPISFKFWENVQYNNNSTFPINLGFFHFKIMKTFFQLYNMKIRFPKF